MMKRVLVIEDEEDIGEALQQLLAEEGYETTCAMTLAEGFAAVVAFEPACIILDLNLPDGCSETLLASLAREDRALPTILLSAAFDAQRVASRFGIPHIRKPFEFEALAAAIATAIANWEGPLRHAREIA